MLDRKYRGRRKGIAVREGAVREARKQAGLSLADVASGVVSRTAILYIENGRTKPSLETLRLISRKTRLPIDYFLLDPKSGPTPNEMPDDIFELERLTARRDFEALVELGSVLLPKATGDDAALVKFYLGQANCRLVRPEEALKHLPGARLHFERRGDEAMAVETLDWEASALGLLEDPQAMRLASEALDRCRRLDPKPMLTEARILGHIANLHVVGHSWSEAARYYEAGIEAAGAVKDLLQLAKMHHGLGTVYQRMFDPVQARQQFDKALALYSAESDQGSIFRVEIDLGYLLLSTGQLNSAEEHLLRALAGSNEVNLDRRGRGFILNNLGEVYLRKGDISRAREYAVRALESGLALNERIVLAEAHALLGKIAEHEGSRRTADDEFGKAIAMLEQINMPDRLRDMHMEYAAMLDARPDTVQSARHWKRAAELGKLNSAGIRWTSSAASSDATASG
jgi:tetratricopeptide (TPR) repeat protein/DNA-binding XRE family transcriptional regulator